MRMFPVFLALVVLAATCPAEELDAKRFKKLKKALPRYLWQKKKRKATSARGDKPSATEQALLDQLYSRLQQPITEEQLIRTLIHRNADLTDRYHPPKVLK